jgi:ubiquinone/menaquinone biosynthesis C-methylase UbiE
MKNYYYKGEEKFGYISSLLYIPLSKISIMKNAYNLVFEDIIKTKFNYILDVGTGIGVVPIMLAKSGKFKKVYGVDPSKYMVNIAKSRSKGTNAKFILGSSRDIKGVGKFDLIFSMVSFHHWAEKTESLKYLNKFLKKGGEIRIYEFERKNNSFMTKYLIPSHSVTKEELIDIGKTAGFKTKKVIQKGNFIRITFVKEN